MILFGFAIVFIAIGAVFFWLNNNSPIQTPMPAICWLLALVFIVIELAACSTPPVQTRIQRELVPIATTPIKPEQVPEPVAPLPPRPSSLSSAADVLLGHWCSAVRYMIKADPLLRLSAGAEQRALPKYPECEGK